MFQGMAKTEQEQKQRAFCPRSQHRSAGGGHQHQEVDVELLSAQAVDHVPERIISTEKISQQIGRYGPDIRIAQHLVQPCPQQQCSAQQGINQFSMFF